MGAASTGVRSWLDGIFGMVSLGGLLYHLPVTFCSSPLVSVVLGVICVVIEGFEAAMALK